MGQRGPKSAEALMIEHEGGTGVVLRVVRPDAPYNLTPEQANVWRAVVDDLPADWFRPHNLALLVQYCRHITTADAIADMMANTLKGKPPTGRKGPRQIDLD